jgi:hypothetical protein
LQQQLFAAITACDVNSIKESLALGAHPLNNRDYVQVQGQSALEWALVQPYTPASLECMQVIAQHCEEQEILPSATTPPRIWAECAVQAIISTTERSKDDNSIVTTLQQMRPYLAKLQPPEVDYKWYYNQLCFAIDNKLAKTAVCLIGLYKACILCGRHSAVGHACALALYKDPIKRRKPKKMAPAIVQKQTALLLQLWKLCSTLPANIPWTVDVRKFKPDTDQFTDDFTRLTQIVDGVDVAALRCRYRPKKTEKKKRKAAELLAKQTAAAAAAVAVAGN